MKLILVPTDFSDNANNAIEYAASLADLQNAKLKIINVYTPAVTQYEIVSPIINEETERAKKVAEEQLQSICKVITSEFKNLTCTSEFISGGIVEAIDNLVDQEKVDLVVMGSRGATGLERILFGSNTAKVLETVKCPVLAVPDDCPFRTPKRIVYATDFNKKEIDRIGQLMEVAKAFQAEVLMVHITTDKEATLSEELLKKNFADKIAAVANYDKISYHMKYEDNVLRGLETFTQLVEVDMVASLTHKRSMFEKFYDPSITKKMAYHNRLPLLALKA